MKAFLLALLVAAGCSSPEAGRTRGGGAGADVGNRKPVVQMHEGARPYHDTPCRTTDVKCTGPAADFGTRPRDSRS